MFLARNIEQWGGALSHPWRALTLIPPPPGPKLSRTPLFSVVGETPKSGSQTVASLAMTCRLAHRNQSDRLQQLRSASDIQGLKRRDLPPGSELRRGGRPAGNARPPSPR